MAASYDGDGGGGGDVGAVLRGDACSERFEVGRAGGTVEISYEYDELALVGCCGGVEEGAKGVRIADFVVDGEIYDVG